MIFLAPFLLAGLAVLPVIWYLLYLRPPTARKQIFPAVMFLRMLPTLQETPKKAALWLFLLRCCAFVFLIIGFAQPVFIHEQKPSGLVMNKTALIIIDNGWSSLPTWQKRIEVLSYLLDEATLKKQKTIILSTSPGEDGNLFVLPTPQEAAESRSYITAMLNPQPWPAERKMAAEELEKIYTRFPNLNVFYIADGLKTSQDGIFQKKLSLFSDIHDIRIPEVPTTISANLLFFPGRMKDFFQDGKLGISVRPANFSRVFSVNFQDRNFHSFQVKTVVILPMQSSAIFTSDLPPSILKQIERVSIENSPSPASTVLFATANQYHPIGLLGNRASQTPLIGSLYYVKTALHSYTDIYEGDINTLLSHKLSVIIAPDSSLNSATTREKLAQWIKKGGMLIRFAGIDSAGTSLADTTPTHTPMQATSDVSTTLLPVPLIEGSRQIGSGMSWGKPQKLKHFDSHSPFANIPIPSDISVSRQVLAHPSPSLNTHVWAQLEDGTPLVTHAELGRGYVVFFHIPATPSWSNLPLSGTFVAMLEHLVNRANGITQQTSSGAAQLAPLSILSNNGALVPPLPFNRPLIENDFETTAPTYLHPAGLYGGESLQKALNFGDAQKTLVEEPLTAPALSLLPSHAFSAYSVLLIVIAFCLLLLDGSLRAFSYISTQTPRKKFFPINKIKIPFFIIGFTLLSSLTAYANPPGVSPPPAALETRLAYVITGNEETDRTSELGLQGLSRYVNSRTSASLGNPDGVLPEKDDLAFYPLLYWPITPQTKENPARITALNKFINHGGIILIDTQGLDAEKIDDSSSDTFINFVAGTTAALKRATEGLEIPPLTQLTSHHVLARTFYLLHSFPGRYVGAPLWVARDENTSNDGVSPIIIGGNNWAQAWAETTDHTNPFPVLPGGETQRKQAYRFGVNLVIYSLTGNYKADQSRVPELLKRLNDAQ